MSLTHPKVGDKFTTRFGRVNGLPEREIIEVRGAGVVVSDSERKWHIPDWDTAVFDHDIKMVTP